MSKASLTPQHKRHIFITQQYTTAARPCGVFIYMNPLAQHARLYLDTSDLSFLLADDAPEKQAITQAFFEEVKAGKFAIFISALVLVML